MTNTLVAVEPSEEEAVSVLPAAFGGDRVPLLESVGSATADVS